MRAISGHVCQDGDVHELGMLHSVVKAVEAAAAKESATVVEAVGLRVGTQSGFIVDALEAAWPLAIAGTPMQDARLELEVIQAAIWCPTCEAEQPIDEFYALVCPACGTPSGNLVRGREFEVAYAELGG